MTGGARALGRQHALALAEAGARVAICDLLSEDGQRTRAELEAHGRPAFFEQADVVDAAQTDRFLDDVEEALGPIDILVNNAARPSEGVALETVGDDLWQEIINVNLSSAFYMGKRVAQRMIERGAGGAIINIASINASVISNILPRHNVTYCVAKAGMAQLTKGMAAEWAELRHPRQRPGPRLYPDPPDRRQRRHVGDQRAHRRQHAHETLWELGRTERRHSVPGLRRVLFHDGLGPLRGRRFHRMVAAQPMVGPRPP